MTAPLPPSLANALKNVPLAGVHFYTSVGSTNAEAAAAADAGAPDLSLFTADEQTAGRGRLDRRWVTNPGSALAFSLLLRPSAGESALAGFFSPWGAVALCEALEALDLDPGIKWPNDVLLNRRKVCGILPESSFQGGQLEYVVIGMGVNITPASVPPAETLRYPAACIEEALGRPADRWSLLAGILNAMLAWRGCLGTSQFRQAWQDRLAFRSEWVTIEGAGGPALTARLTGLADDGSLVLENETGRQFTVPAGEVSLRPAGSGENHV